MFIPAMFVTFRGVDTPIFNTPQESFMGMFLMSLGEFGDFYDSFSKTKFPDVPKVSHSLVCHVLGFKVILKNKDNYIYIIFLVLG